MATRQDVLTGTAAWSCECSDALTWLRGLPAGCAHCCVTSPPYWGLRDYGTDGQIGLEATPAAYVGRLVELFREVYRVLHPSGTVWLNLGDTFCTHPHGPRGANAHDPKWVGARVRGRLTQAGQVNRQTLDGFKHKDLIGVPWRVAFALQKNGWHLRQWAPWVKRNPMPESVTDRPNTACEVMFLLSKGRRYFHDMEAVKRPAAMTPQRRLSPKEMSRVGGVPGRHKDNGAHPARNEVTVDNETRHFRNADPWFDSLGALVADDGETLLGFDVTTKPFKGAHFAVMPRDLVEPCVLAGTPDRGVCPSCGEPWRRVVERDRVPTRTGADTKVTGDRLADGRRDPQRHCTQTKTVGWEPGCGCGGNPAPAVVLEPGAGSGTVLAVAVGLGRRAVGCDLNPKYVEMARKRVRKVTPPLFAVVTE